MSGESDEGAATLRVWHGVPRSRALEWTRVLRTHWPSWPGPEALWRVTTDLADGRPTLLADWAERARDAQGFGFTPALYDRLHVALDEIPAIEHRSHPDNDPDPRWPAHVIRPFDARRWADWPWLVGSGWADDEAARLLLLDLDLHPGG